MFRLYVAILALVAVLFLLPSSSLADDSSASRKRLLVPGAGSVSHDPSFIAARQVQASSLRRRRSGVDDAQRLGFMARRKRGDGPSYIRGKRSDHLEVASDDLTARSSLPPTLIVGTPAIAGADLDKRAEAAVPDSTSPRAWRHGNPIKSQTQLTAFVVGTANEMVN